MNARLNPEVFFIEVEELRRERDQLRVDLASKTQDLERLLKTHKALNSSIRHLYGVARGEITGAKRERPRTQTSAEPTTNPERP